MNPNVSSLHRDAHSAPAAGTAPPDTGSALAPLGVAPLDVALGAEHRMALYISDTRSRAADVQQDTTPLLLVHSVSAAASAADMRLLFARQQRQRRLVVAVELPGFGAASHAPEGYTPALMHDAVAVALRWLHREAGRPVDVMALSLGCEFATEATLGLPQAVRSLALISPTGMEARRRNEAWQGGRSRERPWLHRLLRVEWLGRTLYRWLTSRASMSGFLRRAWGSSDFDPVLLQHGLQCAAVPGARHAPLAFVAGALFTRGIIERYRQVPVPMWVAHGTRGSFTDFGACPEQQQLTGQSRPTRVHRRVFQTGAMPHAEQPAAFEEAYRHFLLHSLAPLPGVTHV